MDVTERIALLVGHCREALYPETLINALAAYLSGRGTLAQVQQEWQAMPLNNPAFPPSFGVLSQTTDDELDELSQRCLDICIATGNLETLLEDLSEETPIKPLFRYLQKQPAQQQAVLEYLIGCYDWMRGPIPTPEGRLLLCYLPEQFPAMLPLMQQNKWDREYSEFLELLAIELDEETRSAWLQHLTDYEITPPFPQLNRPIITLDEAARQSIWWKQYKGYRVPGQLIKEQCRCQRSGVCRARIL